ncbi:MAG: type II toxin-antitoxin system HicB family antitoxin [Nostoc sp.]|uniref:type II toxin-antitoxin system HicB family antitoxin n=1 Tax=Nostoc sp. TaxID=1180 RepID=UPI002FFC2F92
MKREFNVIIERDADGYFVASVPNLPGCHTQAKTLDELVERIREAIELCLEFEEEQQDSLDFVGIQLIALASLSFIRRGIEGEVSQGHKLYVI